MSINKRNAENDFSVQFYKSKFCLDLEENKQVY